MKDWEVKKVKDKDKKEEPKVVVKLSNKSKKTSEKDIVVDSL